MGGTRSYALIEYQDPWYGTYVCPLFHRKLL